MLGIRKIAAGALSEAGAYTQHLLEQTLPSEEMGVSAYYLRDKAIAQGLAEGMRSIPCIRGDLDPAIAKALALSPGEAVNEQQLQALLSGRKADGADIDRLQKKAKRYKATEAGEADRHDVSAFDFCFSAPKSVSIAWAFGGDAERASILQAHHAALDITLHHMEDQFGRARKGSGGSKGYEPAKMAWLRIDHFTSRPTTSIKRRDPVTGVMGTELYTVRPDVAGDPQLHSHVIVPNVLVTEEGRVTSISQQLFYNRKHEFGAFYQAALAQNLRGIGVEVELCEKHLLAKLPAIPQHVCDEFSKRTADAKNAAQEEAARRGLDWDSMSPDDKVAFMKGGAKASRKWKVDDLANIDAWQKQAAAIAYSHGTTVTVAPQQAPKDRIDKATAIARFLLAERLEKQSVVTGPEIRLDATRGLISAGFNAAADVSAVTRRMAQEGVLQDGQKTHLMWVETAEGQIKITTALHKEQEEEVIALTKAAAADTSRALSVDELDTKGLTFTGEHGAQQKHAMDTLATGGALSLVIGCAGAGKTALFKPIVAAMQARGRKVWGVSQAWRQSDALTEAGIERLYTRATSPFLDDIEEGRTIMTGNDVVFLDEISQIGTKDFLRLMRLRAKHGFQIVSAGDDRQCRSIKAGAIIELLRRALGAEAVPEIHTTIRQKSERERDITNLFRECTPEAVGKAIAMKQEDATAELVEGDYADAVERIATLAVQEDATVSAPTNADALAIGRAIRAKRGITGGKTIAATNGRGETYDLELAPGDHVRLFARTTARFETNNSHIGNNGSVLEVLDVTDLGLTLKTVKGKVGFVAWGKLMDGGRVKLDYGSCLTIDSAQGLTSDRHIMGLPAGSASVDGYKAYVAASRHRISSWLVTSKGAEMKGVHESRPLGVADPINDRDIWAHVARNLSRQTVKENATTILSAVAETEVKVARAFQGTMRAMEWKAHEGKPKTSVKKKRLYGRLREQFAAAVTTVRDAVLAWPFEKVLIDQTTRKSP